MLGFVLEEYMIVIIHVVLITPIRFLNISKYRIYGKSSSSKSQWFCSHGNTK